MRQAISKLLGLKTGPAPTEPPHSQSKVVKRERAEDPDNPHSIEDNSDNATRRQLIQMMLRDGLRKHGIPPGWVECRMLVVNSRSRGPGVYVRLVMRHWDMLLLTYANAFQQQFMAAITEFEPQASVWLHGISWELDVGETCPYMDMPDPSIWLELSQPARSSMPVVAAMLQASPLSLHLRQSLRLQPRLRKPQAPHWPAATKTPKCCRTWSACLQYGTPTSSSRLSPTPRLWTSRTPSQPKAYEPGRPPQGLNASTKQGAWPDRPACRARHTRAGSPHRWDATRPSH